MIEIVYVKLGKKEGYYIKTDKGFIPIIIKTGFTIEKFPEQTIIRDAFIDVKGNITHEGNKRIEVRG